MPELPEVETTVKGLIVILDQKISNVKIHTKKLRFKLKKSNESAEVCDTITLENVFFSKLLIFFNFASEIKLNLFLG